MGSIRDTKLKTYAKEIVEKFPEHVSLDFNKNKEFLNENFDIYSKKLRNRLAGYIITWLKTKDNTYEDIRRIDNYNKENKKKKRKGKDRDRKEVY